MTRAEHDAEIAEVRRDMLRGCDTSSVRRCYVCGGVTSTHYGQPPECECEPAEPREPGFDDDDEAPLFVLRHADGRIT